MAQTTFYEAFIREDLDDTENQSESEMNESPSIVSPMVDFNITWQEVKKLIEGLDSCESPGSDDRSLKLLKIIPCEAASYLKSIFGNSLRSSEIPDDWKLANITPLYNTDLEAMHQITGLCRLLQFLAQSYST